ncbi:glycosyltransferase, partial [Patescibacteria group bacterium]|nr:glycosyltransferase [Patescibacteria group bacterium]
MNILRIVYDFADSNNTTGGLSTGPYELSVTQANMGHKIYVLSGNLNKKNIKKFRFTYSLCDGNLVVYNLPRALFESVGPFFSSSIFVLPYYFYLKLTKKIDVIHNHQQMGLWFLIYKKLFSFIDKTPLVHTNHGLMKTRLNKIQESNSK